MGHLNARIQHKTGTSVDWGKATNFIPLDGELIIYSDINRIKIGDGVTKVNDLPFIIAENQKPGEGENSTVIGGGSATGTDSVVIGSGTATGTGATVIGNGTATGDYSVTLGMDTLAGCMGYYIAAIDPANNHIYLHTGENAVIPTWDNPSSLYDANFESGYQILNDGNNATVEEILQEEIRYEDLTWEIESEWVVSPEFYHTIIKAYIGEGNKTILDTDSKAQIFDSLNEYNDEGDSFDGDNPTHAICFEDGYLYIHKAIDRDTNEDTATGYESPAINIITIETVIEKPAEGEYIPYGNEFSISADSYYHWAFAGNVTAIRGNRITYSSETLNTSEKWLSNVDNGADPCAFFIPVQSEIGVTNIGTGSVAEGWNTHAAGQHSHAEGYGSIVAGRYGHAEGNGTRAGFAAHSEGVGTLAIGLTSHAEGGNTIASGERSHAEGSKTVSEGKYSHAEGYQTLASGDGAHAEGCNTEATGVYSHAEGWNTDASGQYSHAEGRSSKASGNNSHSEGYSTTASGPNSHAEGLESNASAEDSHAEGYGTTASGFASHSEGGSTKAEGSYSHAEGYSTTASANFSHAEGNGSAASNKSAHAEGAGTEASGFASHAEGGNTKAEGSYSHAEGYGTTASKNYQHVQGKYNIEDTENKYAHIVGNGTKESARSNAHTLDWDGNAWFAGDVTVGENNEVLVTENVVDEKIKAVAGNGATNRAYSDYGTETYSYNNNTGTWKTILKFGTTDWEAYGRLNLSGHITVDNNSYPFRLQYYQTYSEEDGADWSFYLFLPEYAKNLWNFIQLSGTEVIDENNPFELQILNCFIQFSYQLRHAYPNSQPAVNVYATPLDELTEPGPEFTHIILTNKDAEILPMLKHNEIRAETGFFTNSLKLGGDEVLTSNDYITAGRLADSIAGERSTAEGIYTEASGEYSHAEGFSSKASGYGSHAEGESIASGNRSHAEGLWTTASGNSSHAEGFSSKASGEYSHAEGESIASGHHSHSEGYETQANGVNSHAEGNHTIAASSNQHVQGKYNIEDIIRDEDGNAVLDAEGNTQPADKYANIVGNGTKESARSNAHTLDWQGNAWFAGEVKAEGGINSYITAGRLADSVVGSRSTAEGYMTTASNNDAHAEGYSTTASGLRAHAEGILTIASGNNSHAEGQSTEASGSRAHAEGRNTIASNDCSHAEGYETVAEGSYSHAEGLGTIASSSNQHVQGKYNVVDGFGKYAHIVGNGAKTARSNAYTLDWKGLGWFAKDVRVGSDNISLTQLAEAVYWLERAISEDAEIIKFTLEDRGECRAILGTTWGEYINRMNTTEMCRECGKKHTKYKIDDDGKICMYASLCESCYDDLGDDILWLGNDDTHEEVFATDMIISGSRYAWGQW